MTWSAERFVDGEEFHVDAVWRYGRPWVFFVSRYFKLRLVAWLGGGLNGVLLLAEEDHAELYERIRVSGCLLLLAQLAQPAEQVLVT